MNLERKSQLASLIIKVASAHSNATLFWNFAQNITTSTIGGDSGTEELVALPIRGDYNLTESEGFLPGDNEAGVNASNYVFPSDSFTLEFYCKISSTDTQNILMDYTNTGGAGIRLLIARSSMTSLRAYMVSYTNSGNNLWFNNNIDWQLDTVLFLYVIWLMLMDQPLVCIKMVFLMRQRLPLQINERIEELKEH